MRQCGVRAGLDMRASEEGVSEWKLALLCEIESQGLHDHIMSQRSPGLQCTV